LYPGDTDLIRAAHLLAEQLPAPLQPLARMAYNYRWCWEPDAASVFEAVNPHRWRLVGQNPVAMLAGSLRSTLEWATATPGLVERVHDLLGRVEADLTRSPSVGPVPPEHPVAFLCAEFGVHSSLPIYSGGLGILAGDILKEASDMGLPMVGVGLLYQYGYFHQRTDPSGFQQEYWIESDPKRLPVVAVSGPDGRPLRVTVPVHDLELQVQVWRADIGRVPLYLLDTNLAENPPLGRWVTARLYDSIRAIRLAQYAVLGLGGVRALRAMGIEPSVYHLNEGHPALGVLEVERSITSEGRSSDEAWDEVRRRFVFTTHTPVYAGNETYHRGEITEMLSGIAELAGGEERLLSLGRVNPDDNNEPTGLTPLAIRSARSVNGVSARHGGVARAMWQGMFPGRAVDDVPITHVTNGVHVATWMQRPMRELLDRHLGAGWLARADDPQTWAQVELIPDEEIWATRTALRHQMIDEVRGRTTFDRLRRGDPIDLATAAERMLDGDVLTIGFARRIASYKRLHLLLGDPARATAMLGGQHPVQFLIAGKAHPADKAAKEIVQTIFRTAGPSTAERGAFLEDYDMALATNLVSGCDVWINVPRPPQEASGTSGIKVALNGGLNLSVLDGWWCEGYDGTNGWAIEGEVDSDLWTSGL
jgi:starch phosphorylase